MPETQAAADWGERVFDLEAARANFPANLQRLVAFEGEGLRCSVWFLTPGQKLPSHKHTLSEEVSIVLEGEVALLRGGRKTTLRPGDVLVSAKSEPHGMVNEGGMPVYFLTVISPKKSDFVPVPD